MKCVRVFFIAGWIVTAVMSFPMFCQAAEILTVHYSPQAKPLAATFTRDEQAIKALIEQYRLGYQLADSSRLAATCADFTPALGAALSLYHQIAKNLTVQIADVRILAINDQEARVSFTRHDSFIDAQSGKPMQLQVELTKRFVQQDGAWKMLAMVAE